MVEAEGITVKARNAVLATGPYQKPKLPTASAALSPDICQLHSSEYRNPQMLPSGAVLVQAAQGRCVREANHAAD